MCERYLNRGAASPGADPQRVERERVVRDAGLDFEHL